MLETIRSLGTSCSRPIPLRIVASGLTVLYLVVTLPLLPLRLLALLLILPPALCLDSQNSFRCGITAFVTFRLPLAFLKALWTSKLKGGNGKNSVEHKKTKLTVIEISDAGVKENLRENLTMIFEQLERENKLPAGVTQSNVETEGAFVFGKNEYALLFAAVDCDNQSVRTAIHQVLYCFDEFQFASFVINSNTLGQFFYEFLFRENRNSIFSNAMLDLLQVKLTPKTCRDVLVARSFSLLGKIVEQAKISNIIRDKLFDLIEHAGKGMAVNDLDPDFFAQKTEVQEAENSQNVAQSDGQGKQGAMSEKDDAAGTAEEGKLSLEKVLWPLIKLMDGSKQTKWLQLLREIEENAQKAAAAAMEALKVEKK
ncbi:MAG: hypothetical protein LBT98_00390 [Puniceicoccales bacterium]|jgi:hypothetical protein|nr:hypothetical protein [Puniceicoccales bacterium]